MDRSRKANALRCSAVRSDHERRGDHDDGMVDLPVGTVTLLFSDVEGATKLLTRLGPAYADALDGQRQILRRAWVEHGGTELGTEGDSFFVVFEAAADAVAAAAQAQLALADHAWPEGEHVRVRMGIHTGSPQVHDGGYVGLDVHRAARIASAAHGGQIVISETTARLVEGPGLGPGLSLVDLGTHLLRDIPKPEHLFQVTVPGGRTDFPPLKSLGAVSRLPRPMTTLVGRDGELVELVAVLNDTGTRLLTLTGPGGSGKTRLAIGVAQRLVGTDFGDGVFFVPLAAGTSVDDMWSSIAGALDVSTEERTPERLLEHLAHRRLLIILDNLEQLSGADRVVAGILAKAPQVVLIATSRRPLHVPGEHEHPVPPLELPLSAVEASASGAVQLFAQHARMVRPNFAVTSDNVAEVVEVCRRLDGLPLAIELAAARIKLLSTTALLARLDGALDIPARGTQRPERQRTLRDTIRWSYDLLDPTSQTLFRRLGVFACGADIDAITAVNADLVDDDDGALDLVDDLVDASLADMSEGVAGEPRVGMLETIRAFAVDELADSGELDSVRARHAEHYLHAIQRLSLLLHGDQFLTARASFDIDHDNFRQALAWTLQPDDEAPDSAVRQEIRQTMRKWRW